MAQPQPTRTPAARQGGHVVRKIAPNRRIDFICENLNLGITGMKMLLDGREVDVIAYVITEEGVNADGDIVEDYLIEPIAVFVDDDLEARLTELPPFEPTAKGQP